MLLNGLASWIKHSSSFGLFVSWIKHFGLFLKVLQAGPSIRLVLHALQVGSNIDLVLFLVYSQYGSSHQYFCKLFLKSFKRGAKDDHATSLLPSLCRKFPRNQTLSLKSQMFSSQYFFSYFQNQIEKYSNLHILSEDEDQRITLRIAYLRIAYWKAILR